MAVVQQAGAIVVRSDHGVSQVLLVTARRNRSRWVFPKGHVEPGETLEAAAVREAREEAGVGGTVLADVGSLTFERDDNEYVVEYFLVAADGEGQASEGRRLAWYSFEEAQERLTFDNARDLLRSAWSIVERMEARGWGLEGPKA